MTNAVKLVIAVAACETAGFLGSIFTSPAIPGWYSSLIKPSFNPPNWVFAPVWTALFALMGIAFFLVWRRAGTPDVKKAMIAFGAQLALNVLWSVFFFGLHNPLLALIEIALLWAAILSTIILFSRVSRAAAWLLAPYLLWVSFAACLNYAIWSLNA